MDVYCHWIFPPYSDTNEEQRLLEKVEGGRGDLFLLFYCVRLDRDLLIKTPENIKMCAHCFTCKQFSKIIRLSEDMMCVLAERAACLSGLHLVKLNKTKKQNDSH